MRGCRKLITYEEQETKYKLGKIMITKEEVKTVQQNVKLIEIPDEYINDPTSENFQKATKSILSKYTPCPFRLKSGYRVQYTIDTGVGVKFHHISVDNENGLTDPAEADNIVRKIIGDGYVEIPAALRKSQELSKKVFQYVKIY